MIKIAIDEFPTKCNICGGDVIYTTNDNIYGKKYGSGYCYYCTNCGAYVGTHKPYPKKALGLLANSEMRKWKIICHDLFDSMWKGKAGQKRIRAQLYKKLANELGISVSECHFGWFDLPMLKRAYDLLISWEDSNKTDFKNLLNNIKHGDLPTMRNKDNDGVKYR